MSTLATPLPPSRRRLRSLALTIESPLSRRDVGIAALLLGMLGVAAFAGHVANGGLYSDDWSLGALYRFPTPSGHLQDFLNIAPARPAQAIYLMLTFAVLGMSAPAQLIAAVALAVLTSTLFYAVLRSAGVARSPAWAIAALALLFPSSDATKLWADADPQMLAMSLYFLGILLLMGAFAQPARHSLLKHLASALCFALSIMTYEIAAPLIAVSALPFARSIPRRTLIRRLLSDVLLVALILILITSQSAKTADTGLGSMLTHAKAIASQGATVFSQSLFPFYSVVERRLTLGLALLVFAAGVLVLRLLPRSSPDVAALRQGLVMTGLGACASAAGWAILIPANIVYSPAAGGDGSRINVAAAFGVVLCVYGLLLTASVLVFRGLPRSRTLAAVASLLGALVVGVGYVHRLAQDVQRWDAAAGTRSQVLGAMRRAVPRPSRGAVIYVTGFTEEPFQNIGTFDFPWDLNGATQTMYGDASLTGQPVVSPADLHCDAHGFTPSIAVTQTPVEPVAYGPDVYLVSVQPRYVKTVSSPLACLALGGTRAGATTAIRARTRRSPASAARSG